MKKFTEKLSSCAFDAGGPILLIAILGVYVFIGIVILALVILAFVLIRKVLKKNKK